MTLTTLLALAALSLLAPPAQAQDAHGPVSPPSDGTLSSPVVNPNATLPAEGAASIGLSLQYVQAPLVRSELNGQFPVRVPLLDNVFGFDLAGSYGVSRRVAVGFTLPVWLVSGGTDATGGPALGDLHLWAPIALKIPSGPGVAVSALPYVDLPTGNASRYLGDKRLGGGVMATGGWEAAQWAASGNVGLALHPTATYSFGEVPGGPFVRMGASGAYLLSDQIAFGLEIFASVPAYAGGEHVAGSGEVLGTLRGRNDAGTWWVLSFGPGGGDGVGSADFRAFAGVGWAPRAERLLAPLAVAGGSTLTVVDLDGRPVRNALVSEGGDVVGHTDAEGVLVLPRDTKWKRGVAVTADGYIGADLAEPEGPADPLRLTLAWAPAPFVLRVTDQEGRPLPEAVVTLTRADEGPAELAPPTLDDEGRRVWQLPQGTWTVDISAPGMGRQAREVVVPRARTQPLLADAVLAPDGGGQAILRITITDSLGDEVEGAEVLLDGKPVGSTSTGGSITLYAVVEGAHDVSVTSDVLKPVLKPQVEVLRGENTTEVALPFREGSVLVIAKGPDGAVVDGMARFQGPSALPPMPLGEDGRRVFVLRPGEWQLLISSPTLGLQQRAVTVPDKAFDLIEVEVVLQAEQAGPGDLLVRVVDPDGEPVDNAEITLDGQSLGRTSTGGTLRVEGLASGAHELVVAGQRFVPIAAQPLRIQPGFQEHLVTLAWKPGSVEIVARGQDGTPISAQIRMKGPGTINDQLGPTGRAFYELAPGTWQVLASSGAHGLQTRVVEVKPEETSLVDIQMVMAVAAGRAGLHVRVVDPDGNPVDGAEIRLAGKSLGETSTGGTLQVASLPAGSHSLEVNAPLYAPLRVADLRLANGMPDKPVELRLEWGAGATRIVVRDANGTPITDAMLRVSGPDAKRPVTVNSDGSRMFALSPGSWQVLVSSTRFGLEQRTITVPEGQHDVRVEEFVLGAPADAIAVLLIRVVDPSGAPVADAEVTVDGASRGRTTAGGAILVPDLPARIVTIEVEAPYRKSSGAQRVPLQPGSQQQFVTLVALPVPVDVVVRDPVGAAVDAKLSFEGPIARAPVKTGKDGFETLEMSPGRWQIFADAPGFGVARREVDVLAGQAPPRVTFDLRPAKVEQQGTDLVILERVHFGLDQVTLSDTEEAVLTEVANMLRARPELLRVEVGGHTDSIGGTSYNMELSQRRAETVRQALLSRGVPPERLVARGYGPLRPLAGNDSEDGRATNRRVEFSILETSAPPDVGAETAQGS